MKCDTTAETIKEKDLDVLTYLSNINVSSRRKQPVNLTNLSSLQHSPHIVQSPHDTCAQVPMPASVTQPFTAPALCGRLLPRCMLLCAQATSTRTADGTNNGFTLEFEFRENPYFTNKVTAPPPLPATAPSGTIRS